MISNIGKIGLALGAAAGTALVAVGKSIVDVSSEFQKAVINCKYQPVRLIKK